MAHPSQMTRRDLLLCLLLSLVVSAFFWNTLPVYPFRLLVTLMHETGHALTTVLAGGHVRSVTISPSEGGLTWSDQPASLLAQLAIGSAGYVGSAVSGAALLWAAGHMRSGRLLLMGLIGWMLAVALLWVPLIPPSAGGLAVKASGYARTDGLFTLGFIAALSGFFFVIAWKAAFWVRQLLVVFIATLSCFMALQEIKQLMGYHGGGSDAEAMAALTHIPAPIWAGLWMLMSLVAIGFGIRSLFAARSPGLRARAIAV